MFPLRVAAEPAHAVPLGQEEASLAHALQEEEERRQPRQRRSRTNDLSAFIDEASEIDGKYTFSGTVMLNGKFKGEIFSNDTLIIGEKAVVKASIRAGVILISGEVVGNVLGTERVELRGTARVFATSRRRWWSWRKASCSRASAA